jgi:hypothetical protein
LREGEREKDRAGITLSNILSFSRNGHNRYITDLVQGKIEAAKGCTFRLDIPFIHLETVQRTSGGRHEFLVNGIGDILLSGTLDVTVDLSARRSPPAPAGEEEKTSPGGKSPRNPLHILFGLSLTCPTGISGLHYEDSTTGRRVYFPPEAQLGSGTWRPGVSISLYNRFGPLVPLGHGGYTYGRMLNSTGTLLSDVLTLGIGALGLVDPTSDFRIQGMVSSIYNVHDIRVRDRSTGAFQTVWESHGWVFYFSVDLSIRVYRDLSAHAGLQVPLWKTLEDSPNDLDFAVQGGLRIRF